MENMYQGSGNRALSENNKALQEAEAELRDLKAKLGNGDATDEIMGKAKRIQDRIKALRDDRARIGEAGMV